MDKNPRPPLAELPPCRTLNRWSSSPSARGYCCPLLTVLDRKSSKARSLILDLFFGKRAELFPFFGAQFVVGKQLKTVCHKILSGGELLEENPFVFPTTRTLYSAYPAPPGGTSRAASDRY